MFRTITKDYFNLRRELDKSIEADFTVLYNHPANYLMSLVELNTEIGTNQLGQFSRYLYAESGEQECGEQGTREVFPDFTRLFVIFGQCDGDGTTERILKDLEKQHPDWMEAHAANSEIGIQASRRGDGGTTSSVEEPPVDDEDSFLTPSGLALKYDVPRESLRKRLDRWRKKNHEGWIENPDRKSREAQYLYRVGSVRPEVDKLKASIEASSNRPAKKI